VKLETKLASHRRRSAISTHDETAAHFVLDVIELVTDARGWPRLHGHIANSPPHFNPSGDRRISQGGARLRVTEIHGAGDLGTEVLDPYDRRL
jgi:hypothetical protein